MKLFEVSYLDNSFETVKYLKVGESEKLVE